jgi:hypothetical protein
VTLRQAALTVGFAELLNPVSYAEFTIYPKLVIPGDISATVANIGAHHGLFLTELFCYLINFVEDIVIAWALYILLAPVNRALSLLAAWLQLVYATIALVGTFNLATVYRMLTTIGYLIIRSRYIPWWLGILLVIDGLAWVINSLGPYLYPGANLDFLMVAFFGELVFMLWLLIMGWRIREPA